MSFSDGGAFPPESGVFGELLNIAAFLSTFLLVSTATMANLVALTVYLRHQQFDAFHAHDEHIDLDWTSLVFLVIGWVSAFGMTLVANFQVLLDRASFQCPCSITGLAEVK